MELTLALSADVITLARAFIRRRNANISDADAGVEFIRIHHGSEPADAVPAHELASWTEEFETAAKRPLRLRMPYAFIKTYRPVLDDECFRAFDQMADYRQWCETALPAWLGYGRV